MCLGLPSQSSPAPGLEEGEQSLPEMVPASVYQGLPRQATKTRSRVSPSDNIKGEIQRVKNGYIHRCAVIQCKTSTTRIVFYMLFDPLNIMRTKSSGHIADKR